MQQPEDPPFRAEKTKNLLTNIGPPNVPSYNGGAPYGPGQLGGLGNIQTNLDFQQPTQLAALQTRAQGVLGRGQEV